MRFLKITQNHDGTFVVVDQKGTSKTYQNLCFGSDFHFGHNKPFIFSARGYPDIESHDTAIISRIRKMKEDENLLIYLGDLTLNPNAAETTALLQLFPDTYYVKGNHETVRDSDFCEPIIPAHIHLCNDIFNVKVGKRDVVCCHFPQYDWNRKKHGSYHLHGHTHNQLKVEQLRDKTDRILDVGVDAALEQTQDVIFTWEAVCGILSARKT